MGNVGINELVNMVYDVATKTPESTAKKVLTLLIAGYKALDNGTKPIKETVASVSGETTSTSVKKTTKKSNGKRRKISKRTRWTKTEYSILKNSGLSRSAKIAELRKLGRSRQAVIAKAWTMQIPL